MHSLLLSWTVVNVVAFAASVVWVFKKDRADYRLNVLKIAATLAGVVQIREIYYLPATLPTWRYAGALALLLASTLLYISAIAAAQGYGLTLAFSDNAPESMITRGPYRVIRHPFYTSYLTTYLSGCVLCQTLPCVALFVMMAAVYYTAARYEESKFARSTLGEHYAAYRRATGMFLPRLSRS